MEDGAVSTSDDILPYDLGSHVAGASLWYGWRMIWISTFWMLMAWISKDNIGYLHTIPLSSPYFDIDSISLDTRSS